MNSAPAITSAVAPPQPRYRALLWLAALLAGAFLLSLALGSVRIPFSDILLILVGGEPERATWTTIVLLFRLPKALTALLAGSALAVSGLQMQTLFRNPLAGPFVLGINAGASLGVAIVVLAVGSAGSLLLAGIGILGDFAIVVAATLGAASVLLLVLLVARRVATMTLLILGIMFGYAASALVSILLFFAIAEQIQAYIAWTFGSFGGVTWTQMRIMAPAILLGLTVAALSTKSLNTLLLGEAYARSLGLQIRRNRLIIITSAALLAGTVTAFAGPIGFIGIAVPHLCRSLLNTSDHRLLVPASILLGGTMALLADLVAQLPGTQTVLPLNAVTALLGAPVVVWVILRQRRLRKTFAGGTA